MKVLSREYTALARLVRNSTGVDFFRHFSASARQSQKDSSGNQPPEKDDDDKMSLLVKALLWMMTAYMFVSTLSLLFPNSNQPEVVR